MVLSQNVLKYREYIKTSIFDNSDIFVRTTSIISLFISKCIYFYVGYKGSYIYGNIEKKVCSNKLSD